MAGDFGFGLAAVGTLDAAPERIHQIDNVGRLGALMSAL